MAAMSLQLDIRMHHAFEALPGYRCCWPGQLLHYSSVELQDLSRQVRDGSQRILLAMDWPATDDGNGARTPPEGARPRSATAPAQQTRTEVSGS